MIVFLLLLLLYLCYSSISNDNDKYYTSSNRIDGSPNETRYIVLLGTSLINYNYHYHYHTALSR